ncbi:hypothetical protein CRENBAI_024591 [Crenichthys baileyi]|uniref:Methyltransferase-like protein 16 n=1 Tax=Crenichthys baileyi TaxID=28760 RepID=A0AAV9QPI9_9TELE
MLGKKCSLAPLKEELRKQGVPKVTHTEFCQGRTMRWALAWSFYDDVNVPSPPSKKRKLEKAQKPLSFTLPEAGVKELQAKASAAGCRGSSSVDSIAALLEKTLTELRVLHERVPCRQQERSLFLTAVENTWIHGRQKRREQTRQLRELPRAPPSAGTSVQTSVATAAPVSTQNQQVSTANDSADKGKTVSSKESSIETATRAGGGGEEDEEEGVPANAGGEDEDMDSSICAEPGQEADVKTPAAASAGDTGRPQTPGGVEHFLFKCLLNVIPEGSDVGIEMHWVEGQNKDLMNQLRTYLRNTLLKSVGKV